MLAMRGKGWFTKEKWSVIVLRSGIVGLKTDKWMKYRK